MSGLKKLAALLSTAVALCLASSLACAHRKGPADLPTDDLTRALDALDRKVCLTIGDRTNGPRDECEPDVDRSTYLQPFRDVFSAAPPILKAYLCSVDRLYLDYHSPWNASFSAFPDSQTGREYRTIAVRRGVLENKVRYADWATAWTQHWWTGGPIDRPSNDPVVPRVEIETKLSGPSGTLYHLVAHEVGHLLDRDYGGGLGRRPADKPFGPNEFGYLSWTSPRYVGADGVVHQAVARDLVLEAVRVLDFDGNVSARLAMLAAAGNAQSADPGALAVQNWQPASRDGIATFLDRLDRSPFTTVFSTWRPEDDWTESFTAMMLPSIARRFDIVTAHGTRVRVLAKVLDDASPFAPKRRFIQAAIDRALTDFRARQAASPNSCLAVALAESRPHQASSPGRD
jgi:predicted small lipoprotein YifL